MYLFLANIFSFQTAKILHHLYFIIWWLCSIKTFYIELREQRFAVTYSVLEFPSFLHSQILLEFIYTKTEAFWCIQNNLRERKHLRSTSEAVMMLDSYALENDSLLQPERLRPLNLTWT